jgi:hypothetical protein
MILVTSKINSLLKSKKIYKVDKSITKRNFTTPLIMHLRFVLQMYYSNTEV